MLLGVLSGVKGAWTLALGAAGVVLGPWFLDGWVSDLGPWKTRKKVFGWIFENSFESSEDRKFRIFRKLFVYVPVFHRFFPVLQT